LQSVEERLLHYKKNEDVLTDKINVLNLKVKIRDKVLAEYTKNLEKAKKERDELKLILKKLQNSFKSLTNLLESQVSDKDKTRLGYKAASLAVESFVNSSEILEKHKNRSDKGYHAVPPPLTGNYMPPNTVKTVKTIDVKYKGVFSTEKPKHVMKNNFSPPIIEDWHSDDESKRVVKPVWNNTRRVNYKNFANKFTHPHPKRRFVPQAVLTRSGKINTAGASVTTAVRPVNTAGSKSTVNHLRLISNAFKRGHLQVIRPFNKYSAYKKTIFNKEVYAVKASGCWV
nr:hypothetical protein [Tanacetum cinerariifolium]